MLSNFNDTIISQYSPIASKGGKRSRHRTANKPKRTYRKHKKSMSHSKNRRTRRSQR